MISPEVQSELAEVAYDLIHYKIEGLLNDRMLLAESLPYEGYPEEYQRELLDYLEGCIRSLGRGFL